MRVAVIADVHGDLDALRRVLAAIDSCEADQIWCLGDIVGFGASAPADVVDLVRERCAITLAGNHDRWVTGQLPLIPRQRRTGLTAGGMIVVVFLQTERSIMGTHHSNGAGGRT